MNKKENPIYTIAEKYALEIDLSKIENEKQATALYKSLHSKEKWLNRYHIECELVNQNEPEAEANEVFYDSVLSAYLWHFLEKKTGVEKSSFEMALAAIEKYTTLIESENFEKVWGIYPKKPAKEFLRNVSKLSAPWLQYEENLVLIFMTAYHKFY